MDENQYTTTNSEDPTIEQNPSTQRNTASLLKYMILGVLLVLPFTGFWLGMNYSEIKTREGADIETKPSPNTEPDVENTEVVLDETIKEDTVESEDTGSLKVEGHILLIKDGDVWRVEGDGSDAVKLIDRDTVRSVSRSKTSGAIAYTQGENVTETYEGSKVDVIRDQLYVASEKGTDSVFVQEQVSDWGWVPNSNLLWYETASLQQFYEIWYRGDGNVWLYDTETKERMQLINSDSIGKARQLGSNLKWSPDGNLAWYITYDGENDVLYLVDRNSKEVRKLFTLPYVGGNRGGPQPIPFFQWSPDSTAIYTIFSPYLQNGFTIENPEIILEHRTLAALRIPVDGGSITKIAPSKLVPLMNEETFPRSHYSDDMRFVFYEKYSEDVTDKDISWGMADTSFVMYDTQTKQESTVVENPSTIARQVHYGSPLAWVKGNYIFTINKSESKALEFLKKNYTTNEQTVIASIPESEFTSRLIWNVHFEPKSESLFFHSDNILYILNKEGLNVVAEDVEFGSQNIIDYN